MKNLINQTLKINIMKEYVLLTGASSGIGYEMANQLAAKRLNLILVARTETKLQQMQAALIDK